MSLFASYLERLGNPLVFRLLPLGHALLFFERDPWWSSMKSFKHIPQNVSPIARWNDSLAAWEVVDWRGVTFTLPPYLV